jgi:hypothetical protein
MPEIERSAAPSPLQAPSSWAQSIFNSACLFKIARLERTPQVPQRLVYPESSMLSFLVGQVYFLHLVGQVCAIHLQSAGMLAGIISSITKLKPTL